MQLTDISVTPLKQTPKIINNYTILEKFLAKEIPGGSIDECVGMASFLNREAYIGGIDDEIASGIESMIRFWNASDDQLDVPVADRIPIKLYIDSPGGSLTGCYTIINAIELSKTPVITINTGCAYSAGFFVFIAGHNRLAYSLSSFLFHEGSTTTGDFVDAHKFRNHADFYSVQLKQLKEHVLRYTKITEEEYEKIKKDDYWLTAKEALEKGVVDEILTRGDSWVK